MAGVVPIALMPIGKMTVPAMAVSGVPIAALSGDAALALDRDAGSLVLGVKAHML